LLLFFVITLYILILFFLVSEIFQKASYFFVDCKIKNTIRNNRCIFKLKNGKYRTFVLKTEKVCVILPSENHYLPFWIKQMT